MPAMDKRLVDEINAQYGTSLRLVGRYPVGESGAFRLMYARGVLGTMDTSTR